MPAVTATGSGAPQCTMDGMLVDCEMVGNMMASGAALPSWLADMQRRPGFEFRPLGLGLFRYYVPNPSTLEDQIRGNNDEDDDEAVRVNSDVPAGTWRTFMVRSFAPQNPEALPCPPPVKPEPPHRPALALSHYRQGSGKNVHIPIDNIDAPFPVPTAFPEVRKLINQGTGGKPFVQHWANSHSDPVPTSGQQAFYLGRITFSLNGLLNVYMTGHYQFYGSIGVVDDLFDFNRERGPNKRTRVGELTTIIGSLSSGKPYFFVIDGRRQVDFEGGPEGVTLNRCK